MSEGVRTWAAYLATAAVGVAIAFAYVAWLNWRVYP